MKPNDIKRLILAAETVAESQPHPTSMFLLSWTAWEALRTRFLRLVIKRMGWTIKDADAVIRDLKISSMESAAKVMVGLGMTHPSQWPSRSGRVWRKLLEVQLVRHRLARGFDAIDPRLIRSCSQLEPVIK